MLFNSIFKFLDNNNLLSSNQVVFSRKSQKVTHPTIYFNNSPAIRSSTQKHLSIHFDEKLNVIHHIKEKISKANKGVGVSKKLKIIYPESFIDSLQVCQTPFGLWGHHI